MRPTLTAPRCARSASRLLPVALLAALTVVFACPVAAEAISGRVAAQRALAVLAPQRSPGSVAVFGLGRVLTAGESVVAGSEDPRHPVRRIKLPRLGRRVWLFWEDLDYGAEFDHPSRMVLVDDRSGKVGRPVALSLWPLVDGRDPPFVGAAYREARLRVYLSPAGRAARAYAADEGVAHVAASLIPPAQFAGDCVVTIGRREDPDFSTDFSALLLSFHALGVPTYAVPARGNGEPPNGFDLYKFVRQLVKAKKCTDIVLYVDGHGVYRDILGVPTGVGAVDVGDFKRVLSGGYESDEEAYVTANDLQDIATINPDTTFKLIVDSCFAASMERNLMHPPRNVLVGVFSSLATEESYSYLGGDRTYTSQAPNGYHTGNTGVAEFTYSLTRGIALAAGSPSEVGALEAQGGSLLAHLLDRAVVLGKPYDFAETIGLAHTLTFTNFPLIPPPPAAPTCTGDGSRNADGDPNRILIDGSCSEPFTQLTIPLPPGLSFTNFDNPAGASCTLSPTELDCSWTTPPASFSGLKIELGAPPPAAQPIQLYFVGHFPTVVTRIQIE